MSHIRHDAIGLDQPLGVATIEIQLPFAAHQHGAVFGNILTIDHVSGWEMLFPVLFAIIPDEFHRRLLAALWKLIGHDG
jgi:hypothetical protein